jgi:hypothetical protein
LLILLRIIISASSEHHNKYICATFVLTFIRNIYQAQFVYDKYKITGHVQLRAMLNGSHDTSARGPPQAADGNLPSGTEG